MGKKVTVTVTVVVVSCGNELFLEGCLRALASQDVGAAEIAVADISNEGGREKWIRRKLGKKQRCLYRHLPHTAAGAAKNLFLESAAGEYIAFIGEDICYLPGGLEKLLAQAKESGADMVVGRAAAGNFGGKEYPAAWTVDDAIKLNAGAYTAEELGERALLLCRGWSGDKLFRTAYLRESGLRFSERAFSSVGVVFGTIAGGKVAVSGEPTLTTQDEECIRYRKNPMRSAADVPLAMLLAEEALKSNGKADRLKKSFRTWCIKFAVWAYQRSGEKKRETRETIREKIEPWLKITEHGAGDFLTRKRFFKYCELCSEDEEEKVISRFKGYDNAKKIISIWGSCISRELFNFDKEAFFVNGFVFQCPLNTYYDCLPASTEKIPYSIFLESAPSKHWAQSTAIQMNKTPLEYMYTHQGEYLLIDIADVRFLNYYSITREDGLSTKINLDKHMEKCLSYCIEKKYIDQKNVELKRWYLKGKHIYGIEKWSELIHLWLADIYKLYPHNKIILMGTRFAKNYADGKKKKPFLIPREQQTEIIGTVEKMLLKTCPKMHYIPIPQHIYGCTDHPLKLLDLHYCKTADEYKMEALKKIVYDHASDEQIRQLCDECDKRLQEELSLLEQAEE